MSQYTGTCTRCGADTGGVINALIRSYIILTHPVFVFGGKTRNSVSGIFGGTKNFAPGIGEKVGEEICEFIEICCFCLSNCKF